HHIDVAQSRVCPLGDRAIHEGSVHVLPERCKGFFQRAYEADRLDHQAVELGEDRRIAIGLIVLLVSHSCGRYQPALSEANQLAMYRAGAGTCQLDDLGAPKAAFRLAEE